MNKEEIEVLTRWQDPTIDKYKQALIDIKEKITNTSFLLSRTGGKKIFLKFLNELLDIINKALGD